MSLNRSRSRLGDSIRKSAEKTAHDAGQTIQLCEVLDTDPWTLRSLESRRTLHDDELTLSQEVKRYDGVDGVDEGDTVIVVRKKTGGQIHWIITHVVSDKDPTA